MENDIYLWLYTLFGCGCITSIILFLMPNDKSRGIAEIGCSCVMIFALILPLTRIDISSYLVYLAEYRQQISEDFTFKESVADEINKEIIEQKFEEYILNEAEAQQVHLESVAVEVIQNEEGYYLPYDVVYKSDNMIPESFMKHIEFQLGISEERQKVYENTGDNQ